MIGDLLFYRKQQGFHPVEGVIGIWEHSPYVHVAIDIGNSEKIEARCFAVVKTSYQELDSMARVHPGNYETTRLSESMNWLSDMVGSLYSYVDIVDDFAQKFEHSFFLDWKEHYDCSALAAEFLVHAGIDIGTLADSIGTVTPATLADFFKLS